MVPTVPDRRGGTSPAAGEYSFRDILAAVFKRRWLAIAFFLGVSLVSVPFLLLQAQTYESAAGLLVKKGRAEVPASAKDAPAIAVHRVTEQDLSSEVEILKSRWLIEDTVRLLAERGQTPESASSGVASRVRGWLDRPEVSEQDQLVLHLSEKLAIGPVGKSSLIRVSYQSGDPEWSRNVVKTLTEMYLEKRNSVFQTRQTVSFFEQQRDDAQQRLDRAETELKTYLDGQSVTLVAGPAGADPLASQKNMIMGRLSALETELGVARSGVESRGRTIAALQERLTEEQERVPSSNRENQDSSIVALENALVSLRLRRDAMEQDFSAEGRIMRDLDAQIAGAEKRLAAARSEVGDINGTEVNPVYLSLRTELLLAQSELEGFRSRLASARRQLQVESGKLVGLNDKGMDVERLLLEAETARAAYLLYQKKHEEARISSAMDQQQIVNVSIAQPAERPLQPVESKRGLAALLALTFALLGGVGLTLVAEVFDHTFSTARQVEERLGISHLGSIPDGAHGAHGENEAPSGKFEATG